MLSVASLVVLSAILIAVNGFGVTNDKLWAALGTDSMFF